MTNANLAATFAAYPNRLALTDFIAFVTAMINNGGTTAELKAQLFAAIAELAMRDRAAKG